LALGIARVHAKEIAGEERRLVAAGARAHLDEEVAIVVRILRQQRLLQLGFQALHGGARGLQLFVGERLHRRVGRHVACGGRVALGLAILLVEAHQVRELRVLA
jgi:hypothetical protein